MRKHILWLSRAEQQTLITNISLLFNAGVRITDALDGIYAEIRSSALKKQILLMRDSIEGGMPLWKALKASGVVPDSTISLVRIGEESGSLNQNLAIASAQEERSRLFRAQIGSVLLYPSIVFVTGIVVSVGVLWFAIPRLAEIFSELHIDLPPITRGLIWLGTFIGGYGIATFVMIAVVVSLVVSLFLYHPRTRGIGEHIVLVFPGIGQLIRESEIARFGYLMGTLLQAGIPIDNTISSVARETTLMAYRSMYESISKSIEEGITFQKWFHDHPRAVRLIPRTVQQMLIASEQSGSLAETFLAISRNYEARNEITGKRLSAVLEPILLIALWVGVLFLALSIFLPIYSLIGSFPG